MIKTILLNSWDVLGNIGIPGLINASADKETIYQLCILINDKA